MSLRDVSIEITSASIAAIALDDVVELAVAHMGVDLGRIADARRRQPEARTAQRRYSGVGGTQRQTLAKGGLVDLHDRDTRRLKVCHLVTDGERDLPADRLARQVVADEGPLQHGHGPVSMPFIGRVVSDCA